MGARHCDPSKRREPLTQAQNVTSSASRCLKLCVTQASAGKWLRTALFWAITQTVAVNHYRHFGATCRPRLQVLTDVSGPHLKVLTEVSGQPVDPVFKSLPTFRDNLISKSLQRFRGLSVPSSIPYRDFGTTCRSRLQVLTDVSGPHLKALTEVSGPFGPVFNSLPTFQDLSIPSSSPYRGFGTTLRSRL